MNARGGIYIYNNKCMYLNQKPGNTVRQGGGGTQFPRELSPVNWFCTTRELGPGDRIPYRELGPGGTVFP